MLTVSLASSLEKIFPAKGLPPAYEQGSALWGETFSLQAVLELDAPVQAELLFIPEETSPLASCITLFRVESVPCELAAYPQSHDEDYLSTEPGLFPDVLRPLSENRVRVSPFLHTTLWIDIKIPEGLVPGEYSLCFTAKGEKEEAHADFTLRVVGARLPPQELLYTQWFHVDCIASAHKVDIYSEKHWNIMEKYLAMAVHSGMNTLLTPVFTPALDTEVGKERACTQLLDIEKTEEGYRFAFSRLERFVQLALSCGITHFEISHLFTQWGAGFAPNIYAVEKGQNKRIFGWDTPADSLQYSHFLSLALPAIIGFFEKLGLSDRIFFHVSDEPEEKHIESYKKARDTALPHLMGYPVYDALSEARFFELGLTEHPIAATDHIEPFLEKQVPGLWCYTCCAQNKEVGNRFLAMPSYRNRILGLQLFKFNLTGFLHWGYNYTFTQNSREEIDPYRVTDAGQAFPGGDPFSVYPGEDGPLPSLRLRVFQHALQDLRALRLLESLCGRQQAEEAIGGFEELTFKRYPRNSSYLLRVRENVNKAIEKGIKANG